MTISLTDATSIANSYGPSLVPDHIEDYATDWDAFEDWDREHERRGILDMNTLIATRAQGNSVNSVRLFMQWARDNRRGPFAPATLTVPELAGKDEITAAEFAPWLATFTRWVNEVGPDAAAMDHDWLTGQDLSTLATIEQRSSYGYFGDRSQGFHRLPATRDRFISWLGQHGQTAPDPVVPQGNTFTFDFQQPTHLWPLEQRRAIFEDVLDWQMSRPYIGSDREYQRRNVGYALIPEDFDGGTDGMWSREEWGPLSDFRADVRNGGYTLTHNTTQEDTTDTTTTTEQVIVPIGPDHPDWQRFAEQMADVATRHGMCPEYERIARLMGLPTRKTRIVTRVTLEVPVEIERGNNVDDRALREAAKALLEQSGTISRANREEIRREEIVSY